jgi:CHAT domain-containing protein
VIASSVPVDDNAGKLLAEKFYLNWKTGIPKSEALKQSLLELRNNPKLENPRFWGYVKIYGDY